MYPNDFIKQMEKEREDRLKYSEKAIRGMGPPYSWDEIKDEFTDLALQKTIQNYCNDQLKRYHRYDLLSMMLCKETPRYE